MLVCFVSLAVVWCSCSRAREQRTRARAGTVYVLLVT